MPRVPMTHPRGEEERFRRELADGAIAFSVCTACGAAIWYPRTVCPACMGVELRWERSTGRALSAAETAMIDFV